MPVYANKYRHRRDRRKTIGKEHLPATDPLSKKSVRNNQKSILALDSRIRSLASRLRGSAYRFQMRQEQLGVLPVTGVPYIISLSNFAPMRPIFQAREDDGTINDYLKNVNKVRAGVSGINYSINIADASQNIFTISIFIVKLKKAAKLMVDTGVAGVLNGVDM